MIEAFVLPRLDGGGVPRDPAVLIRMVATRRGSEVLRYTVGAVNLAGWMANDANREMLFDELVSGDDLDRLLIGEIAPDEALAELIASVTEGVVAAGDWLRPAIVTPNRTAGEAPRPQPAAGASSPGAGGSTDQARALVHGTLGSVPPGALWKAVRDPACKGGVILTGMGLALSLDRHSFAALRETIAAVPA